MRTVNQEEQKQIQKTILKRFIEICEKHNLRYCVSFGTLLGTIRHQGYIPWDDDIDVDMPREDYEKFIVLYREKYNDGIIKIIDHNTEKNYHMLFAKLHDTSTVLREKRVIDKYAKLYGVYIDIFPLDHVSEETKNRKRFLKKNYYWIRIINMRVLSTEVPHKNRILKIGYNFLRVILRIIPLSMLTKMEEKRIKNYSIGNKNSGLLRYLSDGTTDLDYVLHESDFEECIYKQFEEVLVKVPVGYDRVLRSIYGDYMKLPPENERINHGLEVYMAK